MKNRKQLLADFYLELLAINPNDKFRNRQTLYAEVRDALAHELSEEPEVVQRIFERMAEEDGK
jgi:hemerythrin superfamily protein